MVTIRLVVGAKGSLTMLVTAPPFAEKAPALKETMGLELVIEILFMPLVESMGKP